MRIPAVDTYLEYTAGVDGASLDTFVTPDLTPNGVAYSGQLSELVVAVNDVETTNYTDNGDGTITLDTAAAVGDTVEIWRETPVLESLVTFPVPTKYSPRDNNKAITQLLLCIQELWGGARELSSEVSSRIDEEVETLEAALTAMYATIVSYVNTAIAGAFTITGIAGATCTLSVSNGDTYLDTPYLFNNGILMVGGSMYNLSDSSQVTLSTVSGHTRITFADAIVGDHTAILVVLATAEGTEYSFDGLRATTYAGTWTAGDVGISVPFVFDKGLLILGGVTYDFGTPGHGVTLTDVGGVSTTITLASAPLTDHEYIVVMFSE